MTLLSQFIELRMGLHFPPNRLKDLKRGIISAAPELGFTEVDKCIDWLLSSPVSDETIETLAGHLTIGETYFFRDLRIFEILESKILPEILNTRRGKEQYLRIWSAGCATGEEPYSLAILLSRLLPDRADWHITILATDIAPPCLRRAAEGLYSEWSFRDTPKWVREGYFERRGRQLAVIPSVKEMVTFAHLNLAEDVYPAILNNTSGMDLILCRNVLMYFSPTRALAVLEKLSRCLVDRGWLAIGPAEGPASRLSPFLQAVSFPGAILFRKNRALPESKASESVRPPIPPVKVPTDRRRLRTAARQAVAAAAPAPREEDEEIRRTEAEQARLLADRGRLAEALALCAEAIARIKLDPAIHYLQATILQEMDRGDEAAAALRRAIYIDQNFAVAHFALGHLLSRQGKKRASSKHLQRARTLLRAIDPDDFPPEAEGMRAGRLIELIDRMENIS